MATRRILNERTDNETLRRKCRTVDTVDDRIRTLLDDLAQTMYEANGVGLAAPQVGVLRRVVVVDVCDGSGLFELVNPVIVEQSGTQDDIEGCLSVSNLNGRCAAPSTSRCVRSTATGRRRPITPTAIWHAPCAMKSTISTVFFSPTAPPTSSGQTANSRPLIKRTFSKFLPKAAKAGRHPACAPSRRRLTLLLKGGTCPDEDRIYGNAGVCRPFADGSV